MNKITETEKAFLNWAAQKWGHFVPTAVIDEIRMGFEAGYEARRLEEIKSVPVIDNSVAPRYPWHPIESDFTP